MATTTPNYGWPVPTSTDLVKDGATAIEALGDAIDATVFAQNSALTLVKSQVIGTTVASVNVTSAFSTTYDAYKIIIAGGLGSTNQSMSLKLGATVTGYYSGINYVAFSGGAGTRTNNNAASWLTTSFFNTSNISFHAELVNPFLAKNTLVNFWYNDARAVSGEAGAGGGFLNDTTSYTDFTITTAGGTITGGTIYVYGYVKV